MEYPFRTITNAGARLQAKTDDNKYDRTVIDKIIISNQENASNKPLEETAESDFGSPDNYIIKPITKVQRQDNTYQPEITIQNSNLSQDFPIYMIGLLAHAQSDTSGNDILYSIEETNSDPFILPQSTDNEFDLTIAVPIGISPSRNVKIMTTEAGMVSEQEFQQFQSSLAVTLSSTASNNNLSASVSYNSSIAGSNTTAITTLSGSVDTNYSMASSAESMAAEAVNKANMNDASVGNLPDGEALTSLVDNSSKVSKEAREGSYQASENAYFLSDDTDFIDKHSSEIENIPTSDDITNDMLSYADDKNGVFMHRYNLIQQQINNSQNGSSLTYYSNPPTTVTKACDLKQGIYSGLINVYSLSNTNSEPDYISYQNTDLVIVLDITNNLKLIANFGTPSVTLTIVNSNNKEIVPINGINRSYLVD